MEQVVLVRYHEIALKGRNRPRFINQLMQNLRTATVGRGVRGVRASHNGIVLDLSPGADWQAIKEAVSNVFGVSNFALAFRTRPDLDAIRDLIGRELAGRTCESFRIEARRGDKTFPMTSEEINRELGAYVQRLVGAPVRLKGAELVIHVQVHPREAYVYLEKLPGPGGLPVPISGRVVCLLSGGIDSPVAAYRMMKRGCSCVLVHFHSYPFLDSSSKHKAMELAQHLNRYQYRTRLYLVPFGEVQRRVVVDTPSQYRVLLYRRLMARIASRIAAAEGCRALVTGESLGQVASQTLDNMVVVQQATDLPIFRPLIGMDKLEIVREAERIGTFPVSSLPDQDCCQLFTPRSPATHATLEQVLAAEAHLDVESLVRQALEDRDLQVLDFGEETIADRSAGRSRFSSLGQKQAVIVQESSPGGNG